MSDPCLFRLHPNLSGEINGNLVQSEIEGGVQVDDLPPGSRVQVKTRNTCYRILVLYGALALITGHPVFCPRPTLVTIHGSTWGGSLLKRHFIGRGMHLEFKPQAYNTPILTSPVQEIEELPQGAESAVELSA